MIVELTPLYVLIQVGEKTVRMDLEVLMPPSPSVVFESWTMRYEPPHEGEQISDEMKEKILQTLRDDMNSPPHAGSTFEIE